MMLYQLLQSPLLLLLLLCRIHEAGRRLAVEGEVVLSGVAKRSSCCVLLLVVLVGVSCELCGCGCFSFIFEVFLLVEVLVDGVQLSEDARVEIAQELRQGAQLGVLSEQLALRGQLAVALFDDWHSVKILGYLYTVLYVLQGESFLNLHNVAAESTLSAIGRLILLLILHIFLSCYLSI